VSHLTYTPGKRARCPFCGGGLSAGDCDDGDAALAHDYPPCERFLTLDPLAFLAEAGAARRRHAS